MQLTDFAANTFSSYGEDGIIAHIFAAIGADRFCVEFGGGDTILGSNVTNLWKGGWKALVLESDGARYQALHTQAEAPCEVLHRTVYPTGANTIDYHLGGYPPVDFMSIDVDGNDYHIWESMAATPRAICIEFNPTIPPIFSIHQERDDSNHMGFGSSLAALIDLGKRKEYTFVGATHCNAFFVRDTLAAPFREYERDPSVLFPLSQYTFLVTDFTGQAVAVGTKPPWGARTPYVGTALAGEEIISLTDTAELTVEAFEARYGQGIRWMSNPGWPNIADAGGLAPDLLLKLMQSNINPILIETTNLSSLDHIKWIDPLAGKYQYQVRFGGGIVALVRSV